MEVVWADSCRYPDWVSAEEHDFHPTVCRSVGWVIQETKHHIALGSSMSNSTSNVAQVISIPMSAVRKVRKLR